MTGESLEGRIARIAERWIYRTAYNGPDHLCGGIAAEVLALIQAERAEVVKAAEELLAEAIYDGWQHQKSWVPWEPRGNSNKQYIARLFARQALLKLRETDQ